MLFLEFNSTTQSLHTNSFDEAIAFIVPHRDVSSSELASFITTIDEVERQTGLDFFAQTPDSIEDNMESLRWEEMWPTSN